MRAHEVSIAPHQHDETAAYVVGKQRHDDCGDYAPDEKGMPLPLPHIVKKPERMVAEVLHLLSRERETAGVKDVNAQLDKRDEEQQVERCDDLGADLRGNLVEAEDPGEEDDDERGKADGRVDADDHAQGEAPCEAPRGDAAAHLPE